MTADQSAPKCLKCKYEGGPFDGESVPAALCPKSFILVGHPEPTGQYLPVRDEARFVWESFAQRSAE